MSNDFDSLPEPVRKALQSGRAMDAIRLLREEKGISLKASKARIDAVAARGVPAAPKQQVQVGLPPAVTQDLSADPAAVALRLLNALRGVVAGKLQDQGLPGGAIGHGSLAPGEQPRSGTGGLVAWVVLALAAAGAVMLYKHL